MESFHAEAIQKALRRAYEAEGIEEQALLARLPNPELLEALARNPKLHPSLQKEILDKSRGTSPHVVAALLKREDLERGVLLEALKAKEPLVRRTALRRALADPTLPKEAVEGPFLELLWEGGHRGLEALEKERPLVKELLREKSLNQAFWSALESLLNEERAAKPGAKPKWSKGGVLLDLLEREDAPESTLRLLLEVGPKRVRGFFEAALERDLPATACRLMAENHDVHIDWYLVKRLTTQKNFDKEALRALVRDFKGNLLGAAKLPGLDEESAQLLVDSMRRQVGSLLKMIESYPDLVSISTHVYTGDFGVYLEVLRTLSERGLLGPQALTSMFYPEDPLLLPALRLAAERADIPKEALLEGHTALWIWFKRYGGESQAVRELVQEVSERVYLRLEEGERVKFKAVEALMEM
jgi:hypothetical protein